jgi:benzodiazapine receptor
MLCSLGPSRPVVALLVAFLFALSSNLNNVNCRLVHGFVPIQRHAATPHNGVPSGGTISKIQGDIPAFGSLALATDRRKRRNNNSKHQLQAVPSSVWWVLSHTTLPFSGVRFVINGTREGGWYRKIDLPPWTPPDRLFGPVWTFLYTCMGIAASRIARLSSPSTSPLKNPLILLWIAHFGLNLSWAPVFFGLQRFRLGLAISYGLIASLAVIFKLFYSVDPTSAFLLIPYALWLSFATFGLNVSICKRNPTKNGYNEGMFQAQLIQLQEKAAALVGLKWNLSH